MRGIFITYLLCITFIGNAQDISITGMVIDEETGEPVFGTTLIYRNTPAAFSDDNGRFILQLENPGSEDTIFFRHLSYDQHSMRLNQLQTDSVVYLHSRFYDMDAVTVQPVDHEKLLKNIVKQYQQSLPAYPYWTTIHQAQQTTYNGKSSSYVEYTGKFLKVGTSVSNAFIENKWYPEYIRRTKETVNFAIMMNDWQRARMSENFIKLTWAEFRFFDLAHPLGRYHKYFNCSVDSLVTIKDKTCWQISFKQEKRIYIDKWPLTNANGVLWVDKETQQLILLKSSCNRGSVSANQIEITYGTCNNMLMPKEINMAMIKNRVGNGKRFRQKILVENKIRFIEMGDRLKKGYKGEYNDFTPEFMIPEMPYIPDYWPAFNQYLNHTWAETQFEEGAKESIVRDIEFVEPVRNSSKQAQLKIEEEIKNLTWKKIE